MRCVPCEVTWWPRRLLPPPPRQDVVTWDGETLPVVDFTAPGALASPA